MAKEIKRYLLTQGECRPETVLPAAVLLLNAFFGAYVELIGCVSTVLLCIAVLFRLRSEKKPVLCVSAWTLGTAAVCFFYLFTVLYAADRGMALLGFVKFLPLGLFVFLCMRFSLERRTLLLYAVPAVGLLQMLFAVPAYLVPALKAYFVTYSRFHGGFGYSNVFALFMLCGALVLLLGPMPLNLPARVGTALVLLAGLLLSGSRTVFLLAAPALVFVLVREKRLRLPLGVSAAALVALAALYGVVSGNVGNLARFLNFSVSESTYFDRLLYYRDALPLILRRPFGLGYKGYMYMAPSVQTGVYSVTFVHNEYLQLMLDVGVLPAALFFFGLFQTLFRKVPVLHKLLLGVIALHMAVDFDLQFLSVLLLLPLLADYPAPAEKRGGKTRAREKKGLRAGIAAACCCMLALGGYLGAAAGLEAAGQYAAALKVYPGLTMSRLALLQTALEEDAPPEEAAALAQEVIRRNKYVAVAYDAAAREKAQAHDYPAAVALKKEALRNAPFEKSEYLDMFAVLYEAIQYADAQKDTEALREYCVELSGLPRRMERVLKGMSKLGRKITDAPDLELPESYMDYIREIRKALGE